MSDDEKLISFKHSCLHEGVLQLLIALRAVFLSLLWVRMLLRQLFQIRSPPSLLLEVQRLGSIGESHVDSSVSCVCRRRCCW